MKQEQIHRFTWQGIEIEVTYIPRKWEVVDSVEVRSIVPDHAPLPISKSGFQVRYPDVGVVGAYTGGVVGYVTAWLDREAATPEWKRHVEASSQYTLF
jgi:hypothetical protein